MDPWSGGVFERVQRLRMEGSEEEFQKLGKLKTSAEVIPLGGSSS